MKDPWPDFIPPQLPRLVDDPPPDDGSWVHEVKFDGYRIQAHLRGGICSIYSRNALDWSNSFPFLISAIEKIKAKDVIFDGEIVALDKDGKSQFQKLQNSLKFKKDLGLKYYIFDILYLNGKDLRKLPLIERKLILKEVLKRSSKNIVFSEHFETSGKDFFEISCEHQLEGIVSKQKNAPYSPGRNDLWIKMKCTLRQEFVIGGWTNPQNGRVGIGAILLGIYEDEKLRYVGKVGTGFDRKTLSYIKKVLRPLERKKAPFETNLPKTKIDDTHWVDPVKVCEVSFSQWTSDGILRHPVFLGLREDKLAKLVSIEKPKSLNKKTFFKISSPEKIIFKKEGRTKGDVAHYYRTVASIMLPYLKDRPLSLVRCPSGSQEKCFFQKHFTGSIPPSLSTFPVRKNKSEEIYISIDSIEGIMEIVQLNTLEIHAWNARKNDYMHPDQIIMDLDPGPGVLWKEVIDAAFELKEILDDLNLKSFVKLTGGKGVHVHIPVIPVYDWDTIKSFSKSLALELVSRNPRKYLVNMSKKLRTKKIFLDYFRNDYGSTAVVPYSLRAKELSTVALPLEWSELRQTKNSHEYTLEKTLKKIKSRKRDPWAEMTRLRQGIDILENLITD